MALYFKRFIFIWEFQPSATILKVYNKHTLLLMHNKLVHGFRNPKDEGPSNI